MRQCKLDSCDNEIDGSPKKVFCSKKCYRLHHRVVKYKKCARLSCTETFEIKGGAKKFCSKDCRVIGTEREKLNLNFTSTRFDYNYGFIFSRSLEDWVSSAKIIFNNK